MRKEIEALLTSSNLTYFELPLVARLLLVTDGTVTELLEGLVSESITLGFKNQHVLTPNDLEKTPHQSEASYFSDADNLLLRKIILIGKNTGNKYLYAESLIAYQTLSASSQKQLLEDEKPIGHILKEEDIDTTRTIINCGLKANEQVSELLGISKSYLFPFRTYQIQVNHIPIMIINEWFPCETITQTLK